MSTNGTTVVEPGGQGLLVLAEPLDDTGARLRHDPDRLGQQHHQEQQQERPRRSEMAVVSPPGWGSGGPCGRPEDLQHLDGLARLDGREVVVRRRRPDLAADPGSRPVSWGGVIRSVTTASLADQACASAPAAARARWCRRA